MGILSIGGKPNEDPETHHPTNSGFFFFSRPGDEKKSDAFLVRAQALHGTLLACQGTTKPDTLRVIGNYHKEDFLRRTHARSGALGRENRRSPGMKRRVASPKFNYPRLCRGAVRALDA